MRKTLKEKAGEPIAPRAVAPTSLRMPAADLKSIAGRSHAASTSRLPSKGLSRHPSTATLGGSVGAVPPRAPTRPKSAYGQYGSHARSKSHHQSARPATALRRDPDEDDAEEAERKGVQAFHISTNPSPSLRVSKRAASSSTKRQQGSLSATSQPRSRSAAARPVSSPAALRPFTPIVEEPTKTDRADLCTGLAALSLRSSLRSSTDRGGRDATIGKGTTLFIKPKQPQSHLPQPSQTPTRTPIRQQAPEAIFRPPTSTPRRQAPALFLSRFTNDRCPDFYNERIEAMERDFRMFKEKMEGDIGQATDYKESLQQLQNKGTQRLETF